MDIRELVDKKRKEYENLKILEKLESIDQAKIWIDKYLEKFAKECIVNFMLINNRYYFVVCHNSAGILTSENGNNVLKIYKHANFSFIYYHDMSKWVHISKHDGLFQ